MFKQGFTSFFVGFCLMAIGATEKLGHSHDKFTFEPTTAAVAQTIAVKAQSMLGGRVFTKELSPQRLHALSLESQKPGIYIIRVMKGDKVGVERLIKQ